MATRLDKAALLAEVDGMLAKEHIRGLLRTLLERRRAAILALPDDFVEPEGYFVSRKAERPPEPRPSRPRTLRRRRKDP